jgi:hypothetical protein
MLASEKSQYAIHSQTAQQPKANAQPQGLVWFEGVGIGSGGGGRDPHANPGGSNEVFDVAIALPLGSFHAGLEKANFTLGRFEVVVQEV